jgi:predicted nuclease of restriction endonuclease-like (RecB) superfamily
MLYERTAISKKPEKLIKKEIKNLQEKNQMTSSMIFKDRYFLNFVNIEDSHSEEDLENSILNQISEFLQELGTDFCFVARQKRMSTQKKDRYLDLLFYNRRLKRLIAIDLKIGEFEPAYKGQMEWYLKWLEENEVLPGEKNLLE